MAVVSIDERDPQVVARRVPGAREGDLIVGRAGRRRHPRGADQPLHHHRRPERRQGRGHPRRDPHRHGQRRARQAPSVLDLRPGHRQGRQAELTLATDMPVTFAYPHPHVSGPQRQHHRPDPRTPPRGHRHHQPPALPRRHRGQDRRPARALLGHLSPARSSPRYSRQPRSTRARCYDALTPPRSPHATLRASTIRLHN